MKTKGIILGLLTTLVIGGGLGTAAYFYFKTTQKAKTDKLTLNKSFDSNKIFTSSNPLKLKDVSSSLNKYELLRQTTNYESYFDNNQLTFNPQKINENLYPFMYNSLEKILNISNQEYKLNLQVYYQLNFNKDCLKIKLDWKKDFLNMINQNFTTSYYDVFEVDLQNSKKR